MAEDFKIVRRVLRTAPEYASHDMILKNDAHTNLKRSPPTLPWTGYLRILQLYGCETRFIEASYVNGQHFQAWLRRNNDQAREFREYARLLGYDSFRGDTRQFHYVCWDELTDPTLGDSVDAKISPQAERAALPENIRTEKFVQPPPNQLYWLANHRTEAPAVPVRTERTIQRVSLSSNGSGSNSPEIDRPASMLRREESVAPQVSEPIVPKRKRGDRSTLLSSNGSGANSPEIGRRATMPSREESVAPQVSEPIVPKKRKRGEGSTLSGPAPQAAADSCGTPTTFDKYRPYRENAMGCAKAAKAVCKLAQDLVVLINTKNTDEIKRSIPYIIVTTNKVEGQLKRFAHGLAQPSGAEEESPKVYEFLGVEYPVAATSPSASGACGMPNTFDKSRPYRENAIGCAEAARAVYKLAQDLVVLINTKTTDEIKRSVPYIIVTTNKVEEQLDRFTHGLAQPSDAEDESPRVYEFLGVEYLVAATNPGAR